MAAPNVIVKVWGRLRDEHRHPERAADDDDDDELGWGLLLGGGLELGGLLDGGLDEGGELEGALLELETELDGLLLLEREELLGDGIELDEQ